MLRSLLPPVLAALLASSAVAQTADELVASGDSAHLAIDPDRALDRYVAALALAPEHFGALWRAARSQVDIAKQIEGEDDSTKQVRDSLFTIARDLAERAVAADSMNAEGHFVLALALGQLSLTKGGNERVRFAREIYYESVRALELDPGHDGAHHILGAWHAEVRRLSGLTRFFARTFLGARFMGLANWDSAAVLLERAVELKPGYIHHRLELAEIYVDLERYEEARAQLEAIPGLSAEDVLDPRFRERARVLSEAIQEK